MFQLIDHTGDFAAVLTGQNIDALLQSSVDALLAVLCGPKPAVGLPEHVEVNLDAIDEAALIVALGNEVLFLLEVEGFLTGAAKLLKWEEGRATVKLSGEGFEQERHRIERPIKAVTHHGVGLEEADGALRYEMVFDL